MKILPVAERELRVAARRRGTWWVRFGVAGSAMVAAALVLLGLPHARPVEQAQILFAYLAGVAFVYALLGGALITSDCVSEEKREGTLGLLFLTSLRGYDVVTGKVVAHSLRIVSGLLALIPVIAVPLLMGGIDPATVGAMALALANTLFLALAIGMLASVLARDSRQAVGGAMIFVGILLGGLPLFRWVFVEYLMIDFLQVWQREAGGGERLVWVHLLNPAVLFAYGVESLGLFGTTRLRSLFWDALAVQHGLAWVLFFGACVLLPRTWRDSGAARPAGGSLAANAASANVQPPIEGAPYAWVVTRDRRALGYHWVGLGVLGVVWFWGYLELREEWLQALVAVWTLFVGALWLKLRLATTACRHLHEHRRSGGFELVLCTPESPSSIVQGQLRGLGEQFFGPLAAVVIGAVLLLAASTQHDRNGADGSELVALFVAGIAVLLLDLWTIAWAGMWLGLRSNRYVRAWALTIGGVLILPWVVYIASLVVGGVLVEAGGLASAIDPGFGGLLLWWVVVAVGVDLLLLLWARRGLRDKFRDLVVGRPLEAAAPGAAGPAMAAGKRS